MNVRSCIGSALACLAVGLSFAACGHAPTSAAPACTTVNVVDVAGAYLKTPVIVRVYWDSYDQTHEDMWSVLAGSQAYWSRLTEYGVGVGIDGGIGGSNQHLAGVVSDDDIQSLLYDDLSTGAVPMFFEEPWNYAPTIYVIYLPPGACAGADADGTQCGRYGNAYHGSFVRDGNRWVYAVIDPIGSDADIAATHEVAEAATDADPRSCGLDTGCGWNVPGMLQGEVADLCHGQSGMIRGYSVAQVWSQSQCSCL